jgi:hypothetical protein
VAGKVVDAEVVETPYGASDLGFFMVVALVTLGTLVGGGVRRPMCDLHFALHFRLL